MAVHAAGDCNSIELRTAAVRVCVSGYDVCARKQRSTLTTSAAQTLLSTESLGRLKRGYVRTGDILQDCSADRQTKGRGSWSPQT
eukprot:1177578-Prorocentrum_minimum.AAC.1